MADYFTQLKDMIRRGAERVVEDDDWIAASGFIHNYEKITRVDVRTGAESSAGISFRDDPIAPATAAAATEQMRSMKGEGAAVLVATALAAMNG